MTVGDLIQLLQEYHPSIPVLLAAPSGEAKHPYDACAVLKDGLLDNQKLLHLPQDGEAYEKAFANRYGELAVVLVGKPSRGK